MSEPPTEPELLLSWLKGVSRQAVQEWAETPTGKAMRRVCQPAAEAISAGRPVERSDVATMLRELAAMVEEECGD